MREQIRTDGRLCWSPLRGPPKPSGRYPPTFESSNRFIDAGSTERWFDLKTPRYTPRILIVDDNRSIGSLWERALAGQACQVRCVGSGRCALTELHNRNFEVVIMDLGLPDMDGLDLIREIRTEFEWIRIIVISGAVADDLLPLVRAAGADAAQSKPVDLNRLRKVVNQLVDSPLCWTSAG